MARDPLLKHQVGVVRCERYGKMKLCVLGRKYGFEGRLYSAGKPRGRSWLPVPTNEARTTSAALRAAKAFLGRVHGKNN